MIVGVYGIGYWVAAADHRRHWPIVLVGLLGKIFGPLGFAQALIQQTLPPRFGVTILTNDLIWWVPFTMMLWDAAKHASPPPAGPVLSVRDALAAAKDQSGTSLLTLSEARPILVTLTRHSGCTFCKEMLADLAAAAPRIKAQGIGLAIVTMDPSSANLMRSHEQGLRDASWVSDPERVLYRALDLRRGTILQLFGPRVWLSGIVATLRGHFVGPLVGDGFQMPGAFVIHRGEVVKAFRHAAASDRADFAAMTCEVRASEVRA
jgi:hypothetical protein